MQIADNDMKNINIKSRLYDYSVEFVDNVSSFINESNKNITYVISKNVYKLYQDLFSKIDSQKIFIMDDIEHKKNMETVMEIINFWKSIGVRKNWKVFCFADAFDPETFCSSIRG